MNISARAALMAGVATVTASAVLVAPSVQPLPPPKPTIQLAADSSALQPSDPISDYIAQLNAYFPQLLDAAGQQLSRPGHLFERLGGTDPDTAELRYRAATAAARSNSHTGIDRELLEGAYHAIEPWVQWGFELAAYGVGWIPWFGWLAPQITIFYHFGEGIVQPSLFNITDWLDGDGTFWQNVGDFGVNETINAFIYLANRRKSIFWLPSLPPLPPVAMHIPLQPGCDDADGPDGDAAGEFDARRRACSIGVTRTPQPTETSTGFQGGAGARYRERTSQTSAILPGCSRSSPGELRRRRSVPSRRVKTRSRLNSATRSMSERDIDDAPSPLTRYQDGPTRATRSAPTSVGHDTGPTRRHKVWFRHRVRCGVRSPRRQPTSPTPCAQAGRARSPRRSRRGRRLWPRVCATPPRRP